MELNIQLSEHNQDLIKLQDNILTFSGYLEEYKNNPETSSIVCRAEVVIQTLINKMKKTQEEFFTNQIFKDLASYISNINNALYNYRTYNNAQYIQQIKTNIEYIINIISKLCFDDKETISTSLATIVGNSKQSFTHLKRKIELYEEDIKDYKNAIQKLQDKIKEQQTIINGFSEQFNKNQIERDTLFANKIADFNEKFTENQEKISKSWESAKNSIESEKIEKIKELKEYSIKNEKEWANIKNIYNEDFQNLMKRLYTETDKIISNIKIKNEEVEKLYGLVGKNATCGNFKKHADNETWVIWTLYITSFVIMFAIAFFMGKTIYLDYKINHTFNWLDILLRVPVSFVFYAPALYLAMEAKKRHNRQIELRDLEIKISAIDPYLKNIDFIETKREKDSNNDSTVRDVKLELAKKLFSPKQDIVKNDNIIIPKELIDLFEQMSKVCNSFKGNNENDN